MREGHKIMKKTEDHNNKERFGGYCINEQKILTNKVV